MKYGPFPMWPAFPTPEYYDPLRLPLDHPSHFPGSPVIGQASLPPAPQADGAETALPGSHDDHSHVQRPIRRRVLQRPLLEQRRFPWPSPCHQRLGSPLAHPKGRDCTTTLTQASLTLQTARSLRPASHPTSRSRTGASLPGTQASPRTGLTPAGHRELIAPTSCGSPFPHGARAVPAHGDNAEVWSEPYETPEIVPNEPCPDLSIAASWLARRRRSSCLRHTSRRSRSACGRG
jgi:hypothetical protein